MNYKKICIIIPSRLDSIRFPNKPLVDIEGKSMIQRVFEQCAKTTVNRVLVATPDSEIHSHVLVFGGDSILTPNFDNGTLRVCYVANKLYEKYDYIINVQGDQPFIDTIFLNRFIDDLMWMPAKTILTGGIKLYEGDNDMTDTNSVKLIGENNSVIGAKYNSVTGFTRSPFFSINKALYKHIGIYGFRIDDIELISSLQPSKASLRESLEQIRWMEEGFKMNFTIAFNDPISIDTPEDLENCIKKRRNENIR